MYRDSQVDALVIIATPYGPAALAPEQLAEALERGRALLPIAEPATAAQSAPERLLDAEQLAEATDVPASWWADQARQGAVPVYHFGRYPRFRLSEILACRKFRERDRC
jgi:hypothetical protein